jgi:hypothetical protein
MEGQIKSRKNLSGLRNLILVVMVLVVGLALPATGYAYTYTVDNLGDGDDGSGYAQGNGTNTLRKCIRLANYSFMSLGDTINFSVSGTISPSSALPSLTDDNTFIIAASRWGDTLYGSGWPAGFPGDTINGSFAGSVSGFTINNADYCQIRGLCIRDFSVYGVYIYGGANHNVIGGTGSGERNIISHNTSHGVYISGSGTDYNVVKANYIGIYANGTQSWANGVGIEIASGAQNNTIGGSTAAGEGNVISGNTSYGVKIDVNAANNVVKGNYIGTDKNGSAAVANGSGMLITDGAQNNTIGGSSSNDRNIISGNTSYGIEVYGSTTKYNTIKGNFIGTKANGTQALGNNSAGIYLHDQTNYITIGGSTAAGDGNVISGNTNGYGIWISGADNDSVKGNYIGTNASGAGNVGNYHGIVIDAAATKNTIGGSSSSERNIISGNSHYGIQISDANTQYNVVIGNYIGTDVNGTAQIANSYGIYISYSATSDTIGGSVAGDSRNVISGNSYNGIYITGTSTQYHHIKGNYIGTDKNGTAALVNGYGVTMAGGTKNNLIGYLSSSNDRNIISGNSYHGINITGSGSNNNAVKGNYIGTDQSGTAALANKEGIYIENTAQSNTIGGSSANERNIISGNTDYGVYIGGTSTNLNAVKGNYIGTDVNGTAKKANGNGVYIELGAQSNTIGGSSSSERNIISGNTNYGVYIGDDNTNNNIVRSNYIGTDSSGTANLGNGQAGVRLSNGAQGDTIGLSASGTGPANIIAFNGADGISLVTNTTRHHRISGNSFFQNTGLAIDLRDNGVTLDDDVYDAATLPDSGIDFPVFDTMDLNSQGNFLYVSGFVGTTRTIASTNNKFANCRVEVYKADPDPTGYGEGKTYLGYLTTDAGSSLFRGGLNVTGMGLSAGDKITGITIDSKNHTSEFGPDALFDVTAIVVSSFTAEAESNKVLVRWKTESEVNTAGFNLYRSPDTTAAWTKLTGSLIPTQGDPITGASYEYHDPKGIAGTYYKLEVVALSGGSIFFGPVKAEPRSLDDAPARLAPVQFAIMPNPVRAGATIQYNVKNTRQVQLTVYDSNGRQVCRLIDQEQQAGNYYVPWITKPLGTGVYFISLSIQGEKQKIKKAIVLK